LNKIRDSIPQNSGRKKPIIAATAKCFFITFFGRHTFQAVPILLVLTLEEVTPLRCAMAYGVRKQWMFWFTQPLSFGAPFTPASQQRACRGPRLCAPRERAGLPSAAPTGAGLWPGRALRSSRLHFREETGKYKINKNRPARQMARSAQQFKGAGQRRIDELRFVCL
jgi:hypothetical protein